MAITVKLLVIEAIRNTVSGPTGARVEASRTPKPLAWTSSPSMTIPKARPGTRSFFTAAAMESSIAEKAKASFFRRSGEVKPALRRAQVSSRGRIRYHRGAALRARSAARGGPPPKDDS